MKKKGLIVLALLVVYVLCFGGYALTVENPTVTQTLEVVKIQGSDDAQVTPLSTIIPYPPPKPPATPPKK